MLHASAAVTVNVRVIVQPLVPSWCVTVMVGVLQVSTAVTRAFTLTSVGRLVGLQPKGPPVGTVTVGGVAFVIVMI